MRWRAMGGPMVLAIWQFAPVTTAQDSLGNVRIAFGYGGGRFEQTVVSCEGDVAGAGRASYSTGGLAVDAWPSDRFRLTGFGTRLTIDDDIDQSGSGGFLYPETIDFYGFQMAYEGPRFGLGLGTMRSKGVSIQPPRINTYMRIGDIDGVHYRADYNNPSPLFGTLGTLRAGVERNTGHLRGTSWFAGLATCHFCGETTDFSAFGELRLPFAGPFHVTAQGLVGSGHDGAVASWGIGLRASF